MEKTKTDTEALLSQYDNYKPFLQKNQEACTHMVQIEYNTDAKTYVSYCTRCGKILDVYTKKEEGEQNNG